MTDCELHDYIYTHEENAYHTIYHYHKEDCPFCKLAAANEKMAWASEMLKAFGEEQVNWVKDRKVLEAEVAELRAALDACQLDYAGQMYELTQANNKIKELEEENERFKVMYKGFENQYYRITELEAELAKIKEEFGFFGAMDRCEKKVAQEICEMLAGNYAEIFVKAIKQKYGIEEYAKLITALEEIADYHGTTTEVWANEMKRIAVKALEPTKRGER